MTLEKLSFFAVFKAIEQNQIISRHVMFSKIEQLPIPVPLKLRMQSFCIKWELQPIFTKVNFKLTTIVTIPRELQFHIYGFYGIYGLFYDTNAKLLIQLTQHEFQEISVWSAGGQECMKKGFCEKTCKMLRNLGVPILLEEFQSKYQVKSFMKWNGKIALMDWEGDFNSNCLEVILKWRNITVHRPRFALSDNSFNELQHSVLSSQTLSVLPIGSGSDLAAEEIQTYRYFSLVDGITYNDARTIQRALDVSDGHAFLNVLAEASECDRI